MPDSWFERAGWDAAHLLLATTRPDKTLCARIAPGGWCAARPHCWECGQCRVRRCARPEVALRRSIVDVHLPEGA